MKTNYASRSQAALILCVGVLSIHSFSHHENLIFGMITAGLAGLLWVISLRFWNMNNET